MTPSLEEIESIRAIVEEVKPPFTRHGGDVEFVDVVDGKVRVRASGYCHR
jgi:Fe-S cluster biogenesis protein NfuA